MEQEILYAKEHLNKDKKPRLKRKKKLQRGETITEETQPTKKEGDSEPSDVKKESKPPGPTALVLVGHTQTMWEQRMEYLKDRARSSLPFKLGRKAKHVVETSESPIIVKGRDVKQTVTEKIEDWEQLWDTSQHPIIWKLRDISDKVFGETDAGYAIGEIMKVDPSFNMEAFLKEMEEYMIPIIIEAYLKPDMPLLRAVTEANATRYIFASYKERESQGHYWDSRVLHINHVMYHEATVFEETPLIVISFVCQHVHCIRDRAGTIVEGSEGQIKSHFYRWIVRRDVESDYFDWKIVDMISQKLHALAA